ncbi:MAG: hypothetical protein FWG02_05085 [Holophagaceae bacterium]|nr:hypothetical protein [Holophagaceae bacterium]
MTLKRFFAIAALVGGASLPSSAQATCYINGDCVSAQLTSNWQYVILSNDSKDKTHTVIWQVHGPDGRVIITPRSARVGPRTPGVRGSGTAQINLGMSVPENSYVTVRKPD